MARGQLVRLQSVGLTTRAAYASMMEDTTTGSDMHDAATAEVERPGTINRKLLEHQKRKIGSVQGLLWLVFFVQLLTLAGVAGLLWNTFLRTG
jgi:hypothetical protein